MSTTEKPLPWAAPHLDRLKAGTAELQPVVRTLRLGALDDWGDGWIRKTWHPEPDLLGIDGSMFGGYIAALADQALAFAAMSVLPPGEMFRTVNLNVNFFRLSRNEDVTIEARVVARSRQVVNVEAEFRNPDGRLFAKASAQQVVVQVNEVPTKSDG
jgi:uncharacterized protein (TIGR00369 family)